jgi:sugar-specific transcriptional regulator TrmB
MEQVEELKTYRALRACGLSGYEAKAYISLCLQGPSTARRVAEGADMPYTKVYDTLSKLERRGMVEALEGRPLRYRAIPPSQVAQNLRSQLSRMAAQAEEALVEELQPLYASVGSEDFPKLIKSWSDAEAALRSAASTAKRELMVHVGWPDASYMALLVEQLRRAVERGVVVRVVVSRDAKAVREVAQLLKLAEVRLAKASLPVNVVVADGSQVLFTLASRPDRGRAARRLTVRVAVKELAELVREYLNMVWEAGARLEEAKPRGPRAP